MLVVFFQFNFVGLHNKYNGELRSTQSFPRLLGGACVNSVITSRERTVHAAD